MEENSVDNNSPSFVDLDTPRAGNAVKSRRIFQRPQRQLKWVTALQEAHGAVV